MKKVISGVAAILLLTLTTKAQKTETIEGNGKIVTRDVAVSSFDALQAGGVYELKLSQGSTESVKIEADENLQQYFDVHNEGSKLVIKMKDTKNKNWKVKDKMTVYVTFKNLKALDLSTVGHVVSDSELKFGDLRLSNKSVGNVDLKLAVSKLDLQNSSVGNVRLQGSAQQAVVKNTGVGKLQAGSLVVQDMDIENTGVGAAEVNAEKALKVKDTFLGKVTNRGKAPTRKMNKVRV